MLPGLAPPWGRRIELVRQLTAALRREVALDLDQESSCGRHCAARGPTVHPRVTSGPSGGLQRTDIHKEQRTTEGHVNRLKLIKWQLYGRASFDLLSIHFLATTQTDYFNVRSVDPPAEERRPSG